MVLSDHIARLIEEMLEEGGGYAEVRRNDLAAKIGCVPSQINYVITSRFTPDKGYVTESRRGGGGHIKIVRLPMSKNEYLMHFFHAIGTSISDREARVYLENLLERGVITPNEAGLAVQALSQSALEHCPPDSRNTVRADILRHMIMFLMMK
jgi:transcriptional regulator CtsR